jgi:hypothetical protein
MLNGNLNQTQILNQNNKPEIIWIDPNIKNEENQQILRDLKSISINNAKDNDSNNVPPTKRKALYKINYDVYDFIDLDIAMEYIKTIKFIATIIIVSGRILPAFIKKFKDTLKVFIFNNLFLFQ